MADETNPGAQSASPAEAENTDAQQQHMIPKARFDEVNNLAKSLKAELEKLRTSQQQAEEQRLAEQNEWKALAEQRAAKVAELEPVAQQVKEIREALEATVAARIERLPEDVRALVPDFGDPRKTLDWLNANEQRLMRPLAPQMDAGARGDSGGAMPKLTDMEIKLARMAGLTPEQWAAQRKAGEELDARDGPR